MWWFLPENWPLFVGLIAGAWFRDLIYMRSLQEQWRVLNEVIDWQRVDDMLAAKSGMAAASSATAE